MYPSQQNATDSTANFFWLLVIIFGAALILWFLDEQYVVIPVFWVRIYEVDAIRFLAELWTPVAHFLHLTPPDINKLNAIQHYMQHENPVNVKWKQFTMVNGYLGDWVRYPVIIILVAMATFMYFRHGTARFRKVYNMKSLRTTAEEIWPEIIPVVSLDLVRTNIDEGPWSMARLPLDFCHDNDLLVVRTEHGKKVWSVKQKPAYRLLALQLGPMWRAIDVLPIYVKALVVIFLGRAIGQRPMTNKILSQIAASAATGKLDFSGINEQLQAFKNHRIILWLEKRHAYVTTLMASMLEISRSDGVLATSEFLWLKPVDRRLWYTLNSVGRQTAVVEVAGAFSHWKAEKKVGRALKTPMVKGAVDALDEIIRSVLYVEKAEQWRTSNED